MVSAHNPASEGFAYNRLTAAKRYLYTVKPWWVRFGERLLVVPVYRPPSPWQPWGATMSTDARMRLFVDRTFVLSAPLAAVAGAFEHAMQHHTRDTWNRLRWLDAPTWNRYAQICMDLEINSSIEQESVEISMSTIQALCSRSALFKLSDLERWQVTSPPTLAGMGAWMPSTLGLPPGLSAEEYLSLLQAADAAREQRATPGSQQTQEGTEDPEGEDPEGEDPEGEDPEGEDPEGEDPEGEDPEGEDPEGEDPEGEEGEGEEGEGLDDDLQEDAQEEPEEPPSTAFLLAQMRMDPMIQTWSGEVVDPTDPLVAQPWKPSEEAMPLGATRNSVRVALDELHKDIEETLGHQVSSLTVKDKAVDEAVSSRQAVEWVVKRRKDRGLNWEARVTRMSSLALRGAQTAGNSDYSYAVRNPNQQENGPILMGLHGYTPTLAIIQDVSRSMLQNGAIRNSTQVFADLCRAVMNRFGTGVTWLAVDREVIDLGTSGKLRGNMRRLWARSGEDTVIGPVLDDLMRGRLVHKGKRVRRPDLVILLSDCIFEWPATRPHRQTRLVVVSVGDPARARKHLPTWLDEHRELVFVT